MNTEVRIVSAVLCVALASLRAQAQSAGLHNSGSAAKVPAISQLNSLLRQPLPAKARAQGPPTLYNPDTLYQYIDGGADLYLLYDFKALLHQDFKVGTSDLTADIYEMNKPEDAFGIYASERSPSYKFIAVGAEGYRDNGILNFVSSRYYVKLAASGANSDAALDQFARLLSTRIAGTRTLPALLDRLPRQNRVPHSEQYVRKDPLGHSFLAPAYVITYSQGKQQSKLVISVAADAQAAKSRADQLLRHFKQSGESGTAPELGENGIRAKNSYEGRVIARTQGRYLIALFNPAEDGAQLLTTTAHSLP